MTRSLGIAVVTALFAPLTAHAYLVDAFGGIDASSPTFGAATTGQASISSSSPQAGLSGGVGGELSIPGVDFLNAELDLVYLTRSFSANTSSGTLNQSQHMAQLPLLVRAYLSPLFSVAAGPYFAMPLGSASQSWGTSVPANAATAQSKSDIGVLVGFRMDFPIDQWIGVIIDTRVGYGFSSNASTGIPGYTSTDVSVFAGVRFSWNDNNVLTSRRSRH